MSRLGMTLGLLVGIAIVSGVGSMAILESFKMQVAVAQTPKLTESQLPTLSLPSWRSIQDQINQQRFCDQFLQKAIDKAEANDSKLSVAYSRIYENCMKR